MPRTKSESTLTSAKKTTKPAVKKEAGISIKLQMPGTMPETVKVKGTAGELIAERNLGNYELSVNGSKVSNSYSFQKNDLVRVGLPTKSAN